MKLGGLATALALSGTSASTNLQAAETQGQAGEAASADEAFRNRVHAVRVATADANRKVPIPAHPTNGDEEKYSNFIGSDSRGLPHDQRGEVDPAAFKASLKAYNSGDQADFEAIPLGGTRKQLNPIGSLSVSLNGQNAVQFAVPPAPALASSQRAGEAVELYWKALLRDVPFSEFRNDTGNADVLAAVEELSKLSIFDGPKTEGRVTPETLFRGTGLYVDRSDSTGKSGKYVVPPGALAGPYISQFFYRDAAYGSQYLPARIRSAAAGIDFLTNYDEWLKVQNGASSGKQAQFDPALRYITTGRDLAEYVHNNPAAFWAASLVLATAANSATPEFGGIGAPVSPTNPYAKSKTQSGGSGAFALPYFQSLLALATSRAIRVAYWQKYWVHRALRPEAYAGLVHHRVANKVDSYPVHAEILNSQALARTFGKTGAYLLPQVYPEGAPIHSSYPGGAAVIAASNVTLLKAFFDENFVIPNPVQPDAKDPTRLIAYSGAPLTVGGELNKLALNYGLGRDWAGIHWRSDFSSSLALGEDLAISLLRDERPTFRETFEGFAFTKFDGSKISI